MTIITKSLIRVLHKHRPALFLRQRQLRCTLKRDFGQNKKNDAGSNKGNKLPITQTIIVGIAVAGFMGYEFYQSYSSISYDQENVVQKELEQISNVTENEVGKFKEGLPVFSLSEISEHKSLNSRLWVTYKEGVYDITDFVKIHPGGPQILKAGGTALEPFFYVYMRHKSDKVYTIMEKYRIGNLMR